MNTKTIIKFPGQRRRYKRLLRRMSRSPRAEAAFKRYAERTAWWRVEREDGTLEDSIRADAEMSAESDIQPDEPRWEFDAMEKLINTYRYSLEHDERYQLTPGGPYMTRRVRE